MGRLGLTEFYARSRRSNHKLWDHKSESLRDLVDRDVFES